MFFALQTDLRHQIPRGRELHSCVGFREYHLEVSTDSCRSPDLTTELIDSNSNEIFTTHSASHLLSISTIRT